MNDPVIASCRSLAAKQSQNDFLCNENKIASPGKGLLAMTGNRLLGEVFHSQLINEAFIL